MAKPKKLTSRLSGDVEVAMRQLGLWLDQRFTEEISAVKWAYPTPPQVRDIVDTGRLRASQYRTETKNGDAVGVVFTWPVEYAQQVHDGGISTRTRQPFPGRPWTQAPLAQSQEKFGEYLSNQTKRSDRE